MEDIVLTAESTIHLNKNIAIRYEHNYCNGAVVLIDTLNEKLWFGNSEALYLINQLKDRKPKTIEEVYSIIIAEYSEYEPQKVIESINSLINDLFDKEFIIIKQ